MQIVGFSMTTVWYLDYLDDMFTKYRWLLFTLDDRSTSSVNAKVV